MARFDIAECMLVEGSLETTVCIVTDQTLFYFRSDPSDGIASELRLMDISKIHPSCINKVDPKIFSPKLQDMLLKLVGRPYYKDEWLGYILVRAEEACEGRTVQKAN